MKTCKVCNIEKSLDLFQSFMSKGKYLSTRTECNECRNAARRKGRNYSNERHRFKHQEWRKAVFERDNYVCQHCNSKENLHAHHVIEWDDSEELRFVLGNGLTLCASCHTRHHTPHKGFTQIPWNKGLKTGIGGPKGIKLSDERKVQISEANKKWIRTEEYKQKLKDAKKPENIEANKLRVKGKTWILNAETGKRIWIDK